jgi:hypothetical protein
MVVLLWLLLLSWYSDGGRHVNGVLDKPPLADVVEEKKGRQVEVTKQLEDNDPVDKLAGFVRVEEEPCDDPAVESFRPPVSEAVISSKAFSKVATADLSGTVLSVEAIDDAT